METKLFFFLCKKHGHEKMGNLLVNLGDESVSCIVIAKDFGVSRETVRLWRNTFYERKVTLSLKPEFKKLFEENGIL